MAGILDVFDDQNYINSLIGYQPNAGMASAATAAARAAGNQTFPPAPLAPIPGAPPPTPPPDVMAAGPASFSPAAPDPGASVLAPGGSSGLGGGVPTGPPVSFLPPPPPPASFADRFGSMAPPTPPALPPRTSPYQPPPDPATMFAGNAALAPPPNPDTTTGGPTAASPPGTPPPASFADRFGSMAPPTAAAPAGPAPAGPAPGGPFDPFTTAFAGRGGLSGGAPPINRARPPVAPMGAATAPLPPAAAAGAGPPAAPAGYGLEQMLGLPNPYQELVRRHVAEQFGPEGQRRNMIQSGMAALGHGLSAVGRMPFGSTGAASFAAGAGGALTGGIEEHNKQQAQQEQTIRTALAADSQFYNQTIGNFHAAMEAKAFPVKMAQIQAQMAMWNAHAGQYSAGKASGMWWGSDVGRRHVADQVTQKEYDARMHGLAGLKDTMSPDEYSKKIKELDEWYDKRLKQKYREYEVDTKTMKGTQENPVNATAAGLSREAILAMPHGMFYSYVDPKTGKTEITPRDYYKSPPFPGWTPKDGFGLPPAPGASAAAPPAAGPRAESPYSPIYEPPVS